MPQLPMADPIDWFTTWMDEAKESSEPEPTAMSLATVDENGQPTVRIVLLKGFDRKGFVFYTNLKSAKGRQLRAHKKCGLCFLWKAVGRQVRIDGHVEEVADEEADAYFASRPRASQIGAWASRQSQALEDRALLEKRVQATAEKFEGRAVDRPPFWSGYRVIAERIEFWQLRPDRLHDRWQFVITDSQDGWKRTRLNP